MPKDFIELICILERDEKCHSYKIIRKRKYFILVTKFPAKNGESTPLKNNASGQQTVPHQDKKEVSSEKKSCLVSSKIYDKRDDFNFEIVNFPVLDGDVPSSPSYGVYISSDLYKSDKKLQSNTNTQLK